MEPDWGHLRSLLAVVTEGSLSGAARALKLTQPTVGRHIAALEADLGVPLFTRSQSGLAPTAAALDLIPHAKAMAASAAALARTASGSAQEDRGTVRVTASEIIGGEVLPEYLAAFREQHPGIDIELVLSNRSENLLKREADIAVRMVRPTQEALIAKKLGTVDIRFYANWLYAEKHGLPRTVDQLRDHPLIGWDAVAAVDPSRMGDLPVTVTPDLFSLRTDSDLAQLAALRAGFGIGGCQVPLAKRDVRLVPVLHGKLGFTLETWLAMHEDLKTSRRVRLLFDFLAERLAGYLAAG